ncbi:MAG: hypothetical protein H0V80_16980 [Acidobacteria bacterium]|nr:hypothetical protein [Acidobacteriota bacterium]
MFGVGNVVTGRGKIKASEVHAKAVAAHLLEHYLGVNDDAEVRNVDGLAAAAEGSGAKQARQVLAHVAGRAPLETAAADALIARPRERQAAIGYDDYAGWIAKVTPSDMG